MELVTEALRYAHDRSWPVMPGTYPSNGGCSCGRLDCGRPGAHPIDPYWQLAATTAAPAIRRWWWHKPSAPILVPTGVRFDALDVPDASGPAALDRLRGYGLRLGPVLVEADRWLFLVSPRTAAGDAENTGRRDAPELDVRYRSTGDWLAAPPSRLPRGPVRWERPPGDADPDAGSWPAAGELLGAVVDVTRRALHVPAPRLRADLAS